MATIQPGTLCLIIGGLNIGDSVTAERVAPLSEVESVLKFKTGNPDCTIQDSERLDQFWKVDREVLWQSVLTGSTIGIPYEWVGNLLPIPPLADDKSTERARELEHTS